MKQKLLLILLSLGVWSISANASDVVSVNFYKDISGVTYGQVSGTFGISDEGSEVAGWINTINPNNLTSVTTSDGTATTIGISAIRPNGNGYDSTDATSYAQTAMRGYIHAYLAADKEAHVTLSNLNANFPNGYKILAYVGGSSDNTGASVSLTEGDAASWDPSTDTTYYFKTRYYPDASTEVSSNLNGRVAAPSTIYVGTGSFADPYYDFYSDAAGTESLDIGGMNFYKGETYTFTRLAGENGHPFSLNQDGVSLDAGGITDGESISLSLPTHASAADQSVSYYCTAHSGSMISNLYIARVQTNNIAGWDGVPVRATDITSDVGSNTSAADYALFETLSADEVTITVDGIQEAGAGLGGIQIIGYEAPSIPIISVNLTQETNSIVVDVTEVSGTFGIAAENSEVSGWINTLDAQITNLTQSDGTITDVKSWGIRPQGSAYDTADNSPGAANDGNPASNSDSDNYDNTPMRGYGLAWKSANNECHVTLSNLTSTFPNGCNIIAYLGGPSDNTGARVVLSEGGNYQDRWDQEENKIATFYYKTRWNPDAPGAAGYHGTLIQTTDTVAKDEASPGSAFAVADYAVFSNVTADRVTITVDGILTGAGLSGYQIIGLEDSEEPVIEPTEYETWLSDNGLSDGSADGDSDGKSNLLEYALGTDPAVSDDSGIVSSRSGSNILFVHPKRAGIDHGVIYTVQTNDDLKSGTWQDSATVDPTDASESVSHTISTASDDELFIRLKVEVPSE